MDPTKPYNNDRTAQREKLRKAIRVRTKKPKYNSLSLKASQKRVRLISNLFRKAYEEDSIVVFRNPFVPTEIFYALDMVPLCLESFSSMFAGTGLCNLALNTAENNHYSRDTCSFIRCALGSSIGNYLPTPDILACTSHYCDAGSKAFAVLSKRYNKNYYFLDIPYHYEDDSAVNYLADQIKGMTYSLAKNFNRGVDIDKLSEAITYSNQAREYFLKANELRQHIPAPIRGSEAIDFAAIVAYTWGSKEIVGVYKTLYEELKDRVKNKFEAVKNESFRVLWRHLRPYYNNFVMDYLENKYRTAIAFEEINYIHWQEMDPEDPYRSLARKVLSNSVIGDIQHWLSATFDMINTYKIDGVISFSHWGCRTLNGAGQILKEALKQNSIPYLDLNGDCIDEKNLSAEQVKTRIDAFIETMTSCYSSRSVNPVRRPRPEGRGLLTG